MYNTSLLRRPVSTDCTYSGTMIVYYGLLMKMIIHIGVGSDVVCSTIIGNASASVCGTDNRRFHAIFLFFLSFLRVKCYREKLEERVRKISFVSYLSYDLSKHVKNWKKHTKIKSFKIFVKQ